MFGWLIPVYAAVVLRAGAPLAYTIGAVSVFWFLAADQGRFLGILPQRIFSQLDSFALMSMPLFILVGEIMNRGGITRALINFSLVLVGRLKGGLGYVNILASVFFSGISGSAVADAAAFSNTLVPEMTRKGYPLSYSGALVAASSIIGPIIPPSIVLIFYGALMQTSVAALFLAGVIPGLLLAMALAIVNYYYAHKDNHPGGRPEDIPEFWPALREAAPALLLPIIILAGIVFGVTTPTEAAGLAVVASIGVAAFYRSLSVEMLIESLRRTAVLNGSIFILLAAVACASYIAALQQLPEMLAHAVASLEMTGLSYLLLLNVVLLVAGTFLEVPVALALLVPLLAPIALEQGAHPVHLGLVVCFNLSLGLISPPLGGSLAAVATVTGIDYWKLNMAVLPFFFAEVVVLLVLVFVPEFSLWLPRLAGLI